MSFCDPTWLTSQDVDLIRAKARDSAWQLNHLGGGQGLSFSEQEVAELLKAARAQGRRRARAEAKAQS